MPSTTCTRTSTSSRSAASRARRVCPIAPVALLLTTTLALSAEPQDLPQPKPVPRMQAVPQPYHQLSFHRDGQEIARYHFGPSLHRPFVFPLIGPSGRSLTRMGHPHDPMGHSHHNSVWISHTSVNGVSFWDDKSKARILHQRIDEFEDTDPSAGVFTLNHWIDQAGKVLLAERRATRIQPLQNGEFFLLIDLELVGQEEVTFGKTPFGLVGVRMAKTIGTHDGGGIIRNSAGGINEKEILWKQAKWVDYSGPITATAIEGITLMDHPSNPNHPSYFHVRGDGWMGSSLTYDAPRTLLPNKPLSLRYALYIHAGQPTPEQLNQRWTDFSRTPPAPWPVKKK